MKDSFTHNSWTQVTHIYLGLKPSINMLFETRHEKFLMHAYFPGLLHNNMFDTWFKKRVLQISPT